MAAIPRVRPYKDFLTPAMHRRFAMATTILVGLCFVESLVIGEYKGLFWTFFPFGMAGIRAGLLFISAFSIFVLRVAHLHVGFRTSNSPYQTFKQYAPRMQTLQTAGWYLFSAWFFSEVYVWSAPDNSDVRRIKMIRNTEKPTLNERAIYFTCHLYLLALLQTGVHLYCDYDRIDMPVIKTKPQGASAGSNSSALSAEKQLYAKIPNLAWNALLRVSIMAPISALLYSLFIRNYAWSFTRAFAKIFWNLPKSSAIPAIYPFHWALLLKSFAAGFLLTMLWEIGNAAFSTYVGQEPLKNGRPITYESRDPNGSLLTGLRGKKLQTKAFAFWELAYIAEQFQGRRKVIFEDIDRQGGTTWSQILTACLDTITAVDQRIADFNKGPRIEPVKPAVAAEPIPELPRIGTPLRDGINRPGDLFDSSRRSTGVVGTLGSFAKSHGQSSPQSPPASKVVSKIEQKLLTPKQNEEFAKDGFVALFRAKATWFLHTRFGWPFRQSYRRRINGVVLGSPYGDTGVIVDAIDSLTRLAVCSLKEDSFGNVQRDVKRIIQTFTATANSLEKFKKTIGFHWTDVEKKQESPEVEVILGILKDGLNQLIAAFGDYSADLRLSQSEMRMAREAAATVPATPEMRERK